MKEKKDLLEIISEHEFLISKVRRRFIQDKTDLDDFNDLKREYKEVLNFLNGKLTIINEKLVSCQSSQVAESIKEYRNSIFRLYENQDPEGKLCIVELFTPFSIDPFTKELQPLQISNALSTVITYSSYHKESTNFLHYQNTEQITKERTRTFIDRKVSFNQAMKVLRKNRVETNEEYAKEILDFLYLIAKMLPGPNV